MFADSAVGLFVFSLDGLGFGQQFGICGTSRLAGCMQSGCTLLHPLQRPEQVDRRRPGSGQQLVILQHGLQPIMRLAANLLQPQYDAVGGCDADRGRSPDLERANGFSYVLRCSQFYIFDLFRQQALVK